VNFLKTGIEKVVFSFIPQLKLLSRLNRKNVDILKLKNGVAKSAYYVTECVVCSATICRI